MRAIVVGAGLMGRWHAHAIRACGSELVAVVDPDESRAHRLAHHAHHRSTRPTVHAALESALDASAAEIVHICTPAHTHEALAGMAVRAGRHVLVEKPFTDTLQSTTELLALADSRAVLACPVHQFLFQPPLLDLHRTLEEIGPVVHLRTLACSAGADRLPSSRWDEIALDILPHHLAIVTRFLDATVSATEWQVGHPAAGELRVMTVAGGASVELTVSMRGRPPRNELTIVGAHGSIHVDLFHGFATVERGAATRFQKIARPFLSGAALVAGAAGTLARRTARWEPAYPGLRELVARMHSAARDGSTPPITPAEVLAVARLRELVAARL